MSGYDKVLEVVTENPGVDVDEFREIVGEEAANTAVELLQAAVEREDVLRFDGKHWIVRKGKYAYSEYDHEVTDSE